jgi:ubiquinone/menaquinone biosynthesis C-methylase UbiE
VAAFLADHGLDAVGVDVSQAMLTIARGAHPHVEFEEGRLDALPIGTETLTGLVCWYSVIYTPPARLGRAFAELIRVLMPGGYVLLAFQAGSGEAVDRTTEVDDGWRFSFTAYRHSVSEVTRRLVNAGFEMYATAQREPGLEHETSPQAFVFARRP